MARIVIIGAGVMGSAMAVPAATNGHQVSLVGTHLDRAQASYRDARGKLIEGRGNLARQAEMLKDLGAKTAKSLPAGLEPDALDDHDDTPANDD